VTKKITLPPRAWATLAALSNLPPTLPGKRREVPVSSTEQFRAALHRLAQLATDSGDASDQERELVAELQELVAETRVRGGVRPAKGRINA